MRVSTGITSKTLTEVTAGVSRNTEILVLDDERLREARRHGTEIDEETLRRQQQREYLQRYKPIKKKRLRIQPIASPDSDFGSDPYAE